MGLIYLPRFITINLGKYTILPWMLWLELDNFYWKSNSIIIHFCMVTSVPRSSIDPPFFGANFPVLQSVGHVSNTFIQSRYHPRKVPSRRVVDTVHVRVDLENPSTIHPRDRECRKSQGSFRAVFPSEKTETAGKNPATPKKKRDQKDGSNLLVTFV